MLKAFRQIWRCSRGATAVEYGLILALIVVGIIGSIAAVGGGTSSIWGNMTTKVSAVTPNG